MSGLGSEATHVANAADGTSTDCRNCATANPVTNRFCGACGAALPDAGPVMATPQQNPSLDKTQRNSSAFGWVLISIVVFILLGLALAMVFSKPHTISIAGPASPANPSEPTATPTAPEPTSATTTQSASGSQWNYSTDQDNMGRARSFAVVTSTNTLNFDFPYTGSQYAHLTIRKTAGQGSAAMVSIERGQFLCGVEDCTVNVRFDEDPLRRFSAVPPSDQSTTVLFLEDAPSFVAKLRRAKTVRIEATFYQEGAQTLEFSVEGFKWP